jgi:hypothetical protein
MKYPQRFASQSGEVIVETVISLGLVALLILGFAQQYLVTIDKMRHERLISQISLGPQLSSIAYVNADPSADPPVEPGFAVLSANTQPPLEGSPNTIGFADTIGNFFSAVSADQTTLFLALGYLTVDEETGVVTGKVSPTQTQIYGGPLGGNCLSNQATYQASLQQYADDSLEVMRTATLPQLITPGPTPVAVPAAAGIKIYDVRIGATTLKKYVPFLPYIFVLLCSEPRTYIFPQTPITTSIVLPRGHAN